MAWTGNLKDMGQLSLNLSKLAAIPSQASAAVSKKIHRLIQKQFDDGVDPYGNPWVPLAESTIARGRFPPPLTDTRRMRKSLDVRPMQSSGIQITIDHPILPHQTGWHGPLSDGPSRPVLPMNVLPATWAREIEKVLASLAKKTLRGK
jgi:hypothetical protein